jgi:flagellum-specific peptidoglycan hydrolase FlgJ
MKQKIKIMVILVASIFIAGLISLSQIHKNNEILDLPKPTIIADTVRIDTFSENALIIELHELKMLAPNIVLAQAKLETGNFKSYLFKKSNNLFGFRNFNGYIKYDSWKSSVKAYKDWQTRKYKGGDYYDFLEHINYAEDTLYVYKLKQFQ